MEKNLLKKYILENLILIENNEVSQEENAPTFGELIAVLDSIEKSKIAENRLKHVISFFGKVTTGYVAELFNAGEFIEAGIEKSFEYFKNKAGIDIEHFIKKYNAFSALKRFYGINDNKGLDFLEIPDNLSHLVEDEIEEKFLFYLLEEIKNKNPSDIITKEWVLKTFRNYTKNENEKTKNAIAVTR